MSSFTAKWAFGFFHNFQSVIINPSFMFILPCEKTRHKIGKTVGNMVSIVRDATTNTFRHKSDVRVIDVQNVA